VKGVDGIMAELLMYERPVRLNRFAHAGLLYTPPADYMFCRHLTAVPLMAAEFPAACRHYPIVFVKAGDEVISAQAVLSLRAGENAFVNEQGKWTAPYIPAFVRRYPFVLADIPGKSADFDVAFDEASPCFSPDHGESLFSAEGEPSPLLKSQFDFLRAFQQEHQRLQEFGRALDRAGLLTAQNVDVVRADRERFGVRNALVVDESKLTALPPATVQSFLTAGYFGWIYSHLISLQCFLSLANRAGQAPEELVPWWAK
jgi:hypothetical protein